MGSRLARLMRHAGVIAIVVAGLGAGTLWWGVRPLGPVLSWIIAMTVVTFLTYGIDKLAARMERRRVSERTLLGLVLVGGTVGALLAMPLFRHKTIKASFLTRLSLIVALQIVVAVAAVYLWRRYGDQTETALGPPAPAPLMTARH